ncbi:MAG: DUF938 domain-containing protein [Aestuariibacter sp.]
MSREQRYCQASENNKIPILNELRKQFSGCSAVLEIGSGTGQHAVYFAQHLPHLHWHTSDVPENHDSILAWLEDADLNNVNAPVLFTIGQDQWPQGQYDGVFTANTSHIMQKDEVELMMRLVAEHLPLGGVFCQYGPFTQNGKHKGEGNLLFDQHLRREGFGGYRDTTELQNWGGALLTLSAIIDMPANNHLLVWHKKKES